MMKFYQGWLQKLKSMSGKCGYTCDSCGEEIFDYPVHRICAACEARLEKNTDRRCEKCGRKTISEGVCMTCKGHMPLFYKGISPFVYRGEGALLVNRMKNGDRRLSWYFGERMAEGLLAELPAIIARFSGEIVLLPVPLTKEKRRIRGYNQAEELAEAIAAYMQAHGVGVSVLTVLARKSEGEQQKHLGVSARIQNAEKAYRLEKRKVCQGKIAILVDDILTTGATGSACARLLIKGGASCVILLTAASLIERR